MKPRISSIFLFIAILVGCASQEDVMMIDYRLSEIERRSQTLEQDKAKIEQTLEEKDQGLRTQSAGLHANVTRLHQEIQRLNGRIEELDHRLQRLIKSAETSSSKEDLKLERLEKMVQRNQERIMATEQYLSIETTKSGARKPVVASSQPASPTPPKMSAVDTYKAAKQAFDQNDYDKAREGFRKLISKHPKSENADNAQFWIGETYYREKWYEKAILEYQKVIEKYPRGNKVPASLLKQGLAFSNLGDNANARLILKELIRKYPRAAEAKIAKQKLKEL